MSCGTSDDCEEGGCGSCGPVKPFIAPKTLPELIQFSLENWSEESYLDTYRAKEWDKVFNEIGTSLAGKNAQATKPLLAVFEEEGPKVFLELCQQLQLLSLEGKLIWWAFEFCKEDPQEFIKQIHNRNPPLLKYAHQQANFYSCFPGNEKVSFDVEKASKVPASKTAPKAKTSKPSPLPTATQDTQQRVSPIKSFVSQFFICFILSCIVAKLFGL